MSSIKDKPLKKIVCDKRITIDVIHNSKLDKIKENSNKINDLEEKINKLKNKISFEENIQIKTNINNELILLKNKLNKINDNEHVDYYLDNGLLLSDYYDKDNKYFDDVLNIPDKKKPTTVLDYMNKDSNNSSNSNNSNNYDKIINNYMVNIDDEYINDFELYEINICKNCNQKWTSKK